MKAFNPTAYPIKHDNGTFNPGMTLLDYFAGQIVSQLVATDYLTYEQAITDSYEIAYKLLEERKKYESKDNG